MNILLTGGSHLGSIYRGFKSIAHTDEDAAVSVRFAALGGGLSVSGRFFELHDDHVEITKEDFRKQVPRLPPDDWECDAIGVSTMIYSRPIWSSRAWGRFGLVGNNSDKTPVSLALLERLIHDDFKYILEMLNHLKYIGKSVFVIEGPRPFRHNFEAQIAGISTVSKIDTVYRRLALAALLKSSIPVVEIPTEMVDEDGFMLARYRHEDPDDRTHANTEFGEAMARRVLTLSKVLLTR